MLEFQVVATLSVIIAFLTRNPEVREFQSPHDIGSETQRGNFTPLPEPDHPRSEGVSAWGVGRARSEPLRLRGYCAREIQRYFGFRREAGYQLVGRGCNTILRTVRHLKRGEAGTGAADLIEKDGRGNAKSGIGKNVVPDGRAGSVEGRGNATAGDNAIGRQGGADRNVTRIIVVDAATDYEIVRHEV
jgi:hypothetical protein